MSVSLDELDSAHPRLRRSHSSSGSILGAEKTLSQSWSKGYKESEDSETAQ